MEHSQFDVRAQSEDGIDAAARISVTLANTDSRYSQIERTTGFKGAKLTVRFVFFDVRNGAAATEAQVLFRGVANAPESITESAFRLTFNNRLSFQRVVLPEVRIQKRCPWLFPSNVAQRQEAIDGGARGQYSPFFRCGYSAGERLHARFVRATRHVRGRFGFQHHPPFRRCGVCALVRAGARLRRKGLTHQRPHRQRG
jgi:hypothetical protein